jgi:prolycopene isomerase
MRNENMGGKYDAVVIGSGMGGLSCATLLAKEGLKVLVCEQSSKPGGYCQNFRRKGFTFSPAVHFLNEFGPNGQMKDAFRILGIPPLIHFCAQKTQRRIITPDFNLTLSTDIECFKNDLIRCFPREKDSIHDYFTECKLLVKSLEGLKVQSIEVISLKEKLKLLQEGIVRCRSLLRYRRKSGGDFLDSHFKDPLLKYLLIFDARKDCSVFTCAGPVMWAMKGDLCCIEDGGVEALPELFIKSYKEYGGGILFNTLVEKIVVENGTARGVRFKGGQEISSRYVISNGDALSTFVHLVGSDLLPTRFVRDLQLKKLSGATFTLYMGVDLDLKEMGFDGAPIHYYNTIGEDPWKEMDKGKGDLGRGKITIRMDSIKNPMCAPEGKHTVVVSASVPYELFKEGDAVSPRYKEIKHETADKIISMAEKVIPGLSSSIVCLDGSTPVTYERETLNSQGASMGWYLSAKDISRFRSQKTPIDNLYQAGHWTFPGGGVPMVILSGINAAKLVLKGMR